MQEKIMVVPRKFLLKKDFQGFIPYEGNEKLLEEIKRHAFFKNRDEVEEDPSLKQIIPYIIFIHGTRVFMMQRLKNSGEARLHNLYSIGVGGHIREEDGKISEIIGKALEREFFEEVRYRGRFSPKPLGFINDDSNDVGKVHFGVCYVVKGSSKIAVREKDILEGKLVPLEGLKKHNLENWSRIAAAHITEAVRQQSI
ncbi:MAG: NUDIX domain-containing protein [Candidatus Aenigmarchaeota archaeon]|nr:NUDIX domain-containing protein [Candidatus Aenigmarchaeota archaeon]